ncbi:MAG TPA: argininosuccinate lyase, partial [Nitrososphaeria archaeon]|nr:argininosuccinate lyase [Nitrososphaeria archaeon]
LKEKAARGELRLEGRFEDVHEFVEAKLIEKLGTEVGGKRHTGRSRNDQVALDIRLRTRKLLLELWEEALKLGEALLSKAEEELETLAIHYTHLQQAQLGYLSHYLISHLDHLLRDVVRIRECYRRTNKSPLGACAVAGSTLPLDRLRVAELLGFDGIVENSIDAVSSRDFALEAISTAAILMTNLSRLAEDLIIWSSSEFDYVELPDSLASPSSVMPHKKNPCILELLRARAGRVIGVLTASLAMLKGIPTGYDRDLQEGKPLIWEALKLASSSLRILAKVVSRLKIKREKLLRSAEESYAPAIELAEALMKHANLSLREAHRLVGALVRSLHQSGKTLKDLTPEKISEAAERVLGKSAALPEQILEKLSKVEEVPRLRLTRGSSSPGEVRRQLDKRRLALDGLREELEVVKKDLSKSREMFEGSLSEILRSGENPSKNY